MGRKLIFLACCLMLGGLAQAERLTVSAELWESPRSGARIVAEPAVKASVEALLAQPGSRLLIEHGRSDESVLQAEELRAWLIALAVEAARIELKPVEDNSRALILELIGPNLHSKQTEHKENP